MVYGPYGFSLESGQPHFRTSEVAGLQGVYLWPVKLPAGYRIAYVGKTDGPFGDRSD
jgi:hypothetical protein